MATDRPEATSAGRAPSARRNRGGWPRGLGMISCIIGCIELLACGWGFYQCMRAVLEWTSGVRALQGTLVLAIGTSTVSVVMAGVLFVAGVQLIRRRPSTWVLHIAYAAVALVLRGIRFAMLAPTLFGPALSTPHGTGRLTGVVVSLMYPMFCLAWFLPKKERDEIDSWEVSVANAASLESLPAALAPTESPTATAVQAPPAAGRADVRKQLELETRFRRGTGWFFFIGGLSILNSVLMLYEADITFVVGLGITQVAAGMGMAVAKEAGQVARHVAFAFEILIAAGFIGLGVLARKKHRGAIILGMILYALDGLLLALLTVWFSVAFHAFALFGLYGGLKALTDLRKTASLPAAVASSAAPDPPAAPPDGEAADEPGPP